MNLKLITVHISLIWCVSLLPFYSRSGGRVGRQPSTGAIIVTANLSGLGSRRSSSSRIACGRRVVWNLEGMHLPRSGTAKPSSSDCA